MQPPLKSIFRDEPPPPAPENQGPVTPSGVDGVALLWK